MSAHNPLLDLSGLTRFDQIQPEHITPALDQLLKQAESMIEEVSQNTAPATWENTEHALFNRLEPLSRVWGVVNHLNAVADTPELREAYRSNLPRITEFFSKLGQNLQLFKRYQAITNSADYHHLPSATQRALTLVLEQFKLMGAELSEEKKHLFAQNREQLAQLCNTFSDHTLDATQAFCYYAGREELNGVPEDVLKATEIDAQKENKTGHKLTLHFPCYLPIMQYADSRALRKTLYQAYVTRASELGIQYAQGQAQWDNTANILKQHALREEQAKLLGFKNYAEVSLQSKMANTPEEVLHFLEDLAQRGKPFAEKDLAELTYFAKETLQIDKIEPWDIAYISEKLRQAHYHFSDQEVKQYFPEKKVLSGLFNICETLFNIHIRPDQAPTWHPDVRFYRIEDENQTLIAQFYLDLYVRDGKRGGAWMDTNRGRVVKNGNLQTPIAYLNCNFSSPINHQEVYLTHDEVITLFHEFGHGLHHMLTQVDEASVAGIEGVEWDAVELPSQFMENFCWQWSVLQNMTEHAVTKKPLPQTLYNNMLKAKNFQSALGLLRQIVFSIFDLKFWINFDPKKDHSIAEFSRKINDQYHVIPQLALSRWPNTFSHIFAGGYTAGYYSYKWAEVLSADAFSAFEEAEKKSGNILDQATGMRYYQEILAKGGSRPAAESFIAFRHRLPKIDALLEQMGLQTSS